MLKKKPSVFASACLFMASVGPFHMTDSFTPVSYSHLNRFAHIQCDRDDCSDTELRMGKNSNRARTEKNLEEMMGDDWRLFRARLVSQEQQGIRTNDYQNNHKSHHQHQHHGQQPRSLSREFHPDPDDKHQARQAHIANVFAGAIASIFSPKDGDHEHIHDIHDHTDFEDEPEIGAADLYACEDPFASEEEIVATTLRSNTNVNKHRWAHPISHIEPGCVLVANEKLGGVFHQTVVLIIDHHEATGSTGIVINRPLPGNLLKIASETVSNVDLSLKLAFNCATVSYGGPVMQEDYSILHGYGEVEGSKKVAPGVFVGGSRELMDEVRQNNFDPHEALFVKGHAAWVPSQLSREISKGVWYTAAVSPDLILRYAGAILEEDDNPDDLWSDILTCMGGSYEEIAKRYAGRGDRRVSP